MSNNSAHMFECSSDFISVYILLSCEDQDFYDPDMSFSSLESLVSLEMVSLDISAHLAATDVNKNKALGGARLTT